MSSSTVQITFTIGEIGATFPYHLAVNAAGVITRVGPALAAAALNVRPGRTLDSVAQPSDAPPDRTAGAPAQPSGQPVALRFSASGLLLRGQFRAAGEELFFLGFPAPDTPTAAATPAGTTAAGAAPAAPDPLLPQLRQQLELSRRLLSLAGHEFKTPLTALGGTLFLLREALKDPRNLSAAKLALIEKWLGLQGTAVNTLKTTVDQVLALNRIGFEPGQGAVESTHPAAVTREAIEGLRPIFQGRCVDLDDTIPPDYRANFDPGLMKRAIEQLISNGLKFSAPESIVRVRLWLEGDRWVLEVADEGRGIPEVDQPRILSPFFRASNAQQIPGTGLGLAIVARTLRLHRGQVDFESVENRGTHFFLRVPREPAAATHQPAPAQRDE